MGALHEGHLRLVEVAHQHAERVAVSIFVNPTQFGPREDFTKYPRPIETDLALCESSGVDLVFNPPPEEMYPAGHAGASELAPLIIDLPQLAGVLDGRFRPGHFRGVCQVVAKLFNILTPEVAVFGQKDYQQLRIITSMVEQLNWPIQIVPCPTLRDSDGLAMSSRNKYLTPAERQRALAISRGLFAAQTQFAGGERLAGRLVETVEEILLEGSSQVPVSIDYVAAADAETLRPIETISGPAVIAVAARVGQTRLIDNVILQP